MKLFYSETSPYARKVRVVAAEKQLSQQLQLIAVDTWNLPPELQAENPLNKVPTLITDDDEVIYDSPVICEFLDCLGGSPWLIPPPSDGARWRVLRMEALADGLMDAAVERFVELARPTEKQHPFWLDRQVAHIERVLDSLETEQFADIDTISVGTLALACALGYLDIRFPGDRWRRRRPLLESWFAGVSQRESMQTTFPRPDAHRQAAARPEHPLPS